MSRLKDVCVDCRDPWTLAHWWADVLGYRVRPYGEDDMAALRRAGIERPEDDPNVAVDPVDEPGPSFWFNKVREVTAGKNSWHVDVHGDVQELVARGAVVVDRQERWTVMADPEGNVFCVFPG